MIVGQCLSVCLHVHMVHRLAESREGLSVIHKLFFGGDFMKNIL